MNVGMLVSFSETISSKGGFGIYLVAQHQGECFCGAAGHTADCPDLVAGLAEPAMMVNILFLLLFLGQHPFAFAFPWSTSFFQTRHDG